ncbi:MAG TPA: NUDIX hydrolase [Myxococcota bacterium]
MTRKHIFKGRVIDVGTEEVTLPSGVTVTLDVIKHPGASLIVPIDDDGNILLIKQYRYCAGGYLWECPAGTLNAGETPEQCARREVTEEAGVVAGSLEHAGFVFTVPGFCDEKIHIFVARDLTQAPKHPDDDEVITDVVATPYAECLAMVERGEIHDAKTIAALLHARRFLRA